MVANSISWAENRGLSRANPVHGKQEYRVPTTWDFSNRELNRTTTRVSGVSEVEASPGLVELGIGGIHHAHIHLSSQSFFWQDGVGLLVGEGADLTAERTIMNLCNKWSMCDHTIYIY